MFLANDSGVRNWSSMLQCWPIATWSILGLCTAIGSKTVTVIY